MAVIESSQNRVIKEIKALSEKKHRDDKGVFIADGLRFVMEIPEDMNIEKIVFSESFASKNDISKFENRTECFVISDKLFASLSDTKNPQGIMAVCPKRVYKTKRNGVFTPFLFVIKIFID